MQYTFETHPDFPLARPETRKEVFVLLDKYFPGITDEIKIDSLQMLDQRNCVLGQTVGWRNCGSMFKSEGESPQVGWNFATGTDSWKQALLEYRSEKPLLVKTQASLSGLDAKIAAAKAELDKLLKEKQDLEALDQEVTIKLTRREVQDLLNRKVGNVKQKILKQIA